MNSNGWTPERRQKQREAIQRWKPWQQSTGPRTDAGKAASSRNGYKGGHWKELRELRRHLAEMIREAKELQSIVPR